LGYLFHFDNITLIPVNGSGAGTSNKKSSVGPIVGGVVGGIVVLALFGLGFFFYSRRQSKGQGNTVLDGESRESEKENHGFLAALKRRTGTPFSQPETTSTHQSDSINMEKYNRPSLGVPEIQEYRARTPRVAGEDPNAPDEYPDFHHR